MRPPNIPHLRFLHLALRSKTLSFTDPEPPRYELTARNSELFSIKGEFLSYNLVPASRKMPGRRKEISVYVFTAMRRPQQG